MTHIRYFLSYSSVKLPLKRVNEITEADLNYRNFYYRGEYDDSGLLLHCQKNRLQRSGIEKPLSLRQQRGFGMGAN